MPEYYNDESRADLSPGLFIEFVVTSPSVTKRKTTTVRVVSKDTGECEAIVMWHGRRGYCLHAGPSTAFGSKCIADVMRVVTSLNQAYKEGVRQRKAEAKMLQAA